MVGGVEPYLVSKLFDDGGYLRSVHEHRQAVYLRAQGAQDSLNGPSRDCGE
jgi:hypothetical protein